MGPVYIHRNAILFKSYVVVVEASAPKVYPRVTLASARTLSGVLLLHWINKHSPETAWSGYFSGAVNTLIAQRYGILALPATFFS